MAMATARRPATVLALTSMAACLILAGAGCGQTRERARSAQDSTVQVVADGCKRKAVLGGGAFVAGNRVVTVAHVVAGATSVKVRMADGTVLPAEVVGIDRHKDLAVLSVSGEVDVPALPTGTMAATATGNFVVYRDERPVSTPFQSIKYVDIDAPHIDGDGSSLRRGYQVAAQIAPGDSGAVLVVNGVATAVVFARSTATDGKAWAVDITEFAALLASDDGSPVERGACVGVA